MADNKPFQDILTNPDFDGDSDKSKLIFEHYKLYVEMADRVSARRLTANSFFLGINTAIIAIAGYIKSACGEPAIRQYYWLIAIAGLVISYSWYRHIRSYRDLNSAKFKVIHEIEKLLPLKPYGAEWEAVGRGKNPKLYKPVSHIETGVPLIFFAANIFVILWSIPWQILFQTCAH